MKIRFFGALLVFLAGAGLAPAADDPYAQGLAAIEKDGFNGLDRAVAFFQSALTSPEQARDSRLAIARARILQFELSDSPKPAWLQEARTHLEALLRERALDVDARFLMSQLLLDDGKPEEAMTHLRRAALAAPDREEVVTAYFYRLLDLGQIDQALLYARRRLADTPSPALAEIMTQGLLEAGDAAAASEIAALGLAAVPRQPDLLALAARAARQAGDYPAAIARLEELMRAAPDRNEPLFEIGMVFGLTGDLDKAIAWTRRFLDRVPGHAPALNNLAIFLERSGDAAAATAVWRHILTLPDGDSVHRRRAQQRVDSSSGR